MNEIRERFSKEASLNSRERLPMRKGDFHDALNRKATPGVVVLEAARRGAACIIIYKKVTDSKVRRIPAIPLSYGYRRMKNGKMAKVLWVQDVRELVRGNRKSMKCLIFRKIIIAALTDTKIRPGLPQRILEQMQEK